MHPAVLFENIRVFGDMDNEKATYLKSVHPMNFIGTDMVITVIEAIIRHKTNKDNEKISKKILVTNNVYAKNEIKEMASFVEARINAYNLMHKKSALKDFEVVSANRLCCGVLRIE